MPLGWVNDGLTAAACELFGPPGARPLPLQQEHGVEGVQLQLVAVQVTVPVT